MSLTRRKLSPGHLPGGPVVDLGPALLRAALGYASARVLELLDPDALSAALGVPIPDAAARTRVVGHLAQAQTRADALAVAVAQPVTLDNARNAAGHLGATVTHLRAAAAELGADADGTLARALAGAPAPRGLAAQLGLSAPPGVRVSPDGLAYTLSSTDVLLAAAFRIQRVRLVALVAASGELSLDLDLSGTGMSLGHAIGAVPNAVLGTAGLAVTADLGLRVDTTRGLTTRGTLGPVALPARSPSPLLEGLAATLRLEEPVPVVRLTARSRGDLGGAVKALVEGFGLDIPVDPQAVLDGASPVGAPVPKAPDSLGLSISAGPVTGGGYIAVREVAEGRRYSGALRLRVGPIDVKAFGVLTDRGDGFSLAVVLSVEFAPPIEIAMGFTLNGVGGILGLDVRVDTDVLRSQLRSGVLERLLFPPDPVAAAPAILQTLASVFPPSRGGFVVGPMLSLGWGRPVSFVKLDLAVLLALPEPTVILLGRLRVALPGPAAPLIDLKAEVYGEFSARRVLILVSLVDSRVATFAVSGDIGLLARFGDDATFAISAGGFHPRYDPPPELVGLRRMCVEISPPAGLQLRVEGYVALTTNTVQFGGRVEIGYSAGVAGVYGYLALDALIRFSPFGFEVDIAAGVGVEVLGFTLVSIDLALHLSGPAPWRVHGSGRVNLPWPLPDPRIDFGPIEWGRGASVAGPTVSPARLVATALSASAAWSRVDSPGRVSPVTLREVEPGAGEVLVDPWSLVRGTQTAVPLDTDITHVGDARVAPGENRVLLGDPTIADTAGARWSLDAQPFPLGQYLDLTDDAALAAPSFERRPAGLVVDPADLAGPTAPPVQATLKYETSFPGEPTPSRSGDRIFDAYEPALSLSATSAGRSELRAASRYDAVREPITVAPASEVRAVSTTSLAPVVDVGRVAWSDAAGALRATGLPPSLAQLVGAGV